jgi:outer membrane lipoprotein-sorting protein
MIYRHYIVHLYQRLMVFLLLSAILCTLFSSSVSAAQPGELQGFLDEIQSASDKVAAFSCDFVQERNLALFAEPVLFYGSLSIARPDRLRWEFKKPLPSVLVFSGDQGMRCSGDTPPVHFDLGSDPIMRTVAEQLWLWLGGDYTQLEELYLLEKAGPATLRISPQDDTIAEYIDAVSITFTAVDRQPEKVEIIEPGGDSTVITFHSCVLNNSPPDILFTACGTNE